MMAFSIESYYQALGLSKSASQEDIKRAYRKKAKVLHPDRNGSPEAHDHFMLLTEAYEYLTDLTTDHSDDQQSTVSFEDWHEHHKEEARERARKYARMRYETFTKTDYYKKSQAALTVWNHFYFMSCIILLLSPLWGYIMKDWAGFFGGLFATFISVHFWADVFREKSKVNFRSFFHSAGIILRTKTFLYVITALANLCLFFIYTLNTQLTVWVIGADFVAIYTLFFLSLKLKVVHFAPITRKTIAACWIPSAFNLFFFINFAFSSNPTVEKFSFTHKEEWYDRSYGRGGWEKVASIYLPDETYSAYSWFTVFFDFEAMENKREIGYTFEEGFFGLRVLKKHEFTK